MRIMIHHMKYILIGFGLFFLTGNILAQNEWVVPEDKVGNVAPFEFTEATVKTGEKLYNTNCQSCHGQPGKENYIALNPIPGDLAWPEVQSQTDGELFYKFTEGRGAMPSFKNILSAEERWALVAYIRTYKADYVQPSTEMAKAFSGAAVLLNTIYDAAEHTLKVTANEMGDAGAAGDPAPGLDLALFAKRYFGDLKLDEEKTTGPDGSVTFMIPTDLPGDTAGMLHCFVRVVNNDDYSNVKEEITLTTNQKADDYSLTEERAMWGSMKKIPIWLLATYLVVVLGVFGTLAYIALLIRKIYLAGKQNDTN
jgi:mono/diheme cytochrome c family protein